jgi:chromosome partitioning protein
MSTRIVAVLNQKGGVGKTTTCVNLGAALARRGRRVLLIDMDPQANLTVHLGLDPQGVEASTYSVLLGQDALAAAAHETSTPGLRAVPSTLALANAEIQLASAVGRELILKEALEEFLWPSSSIATRPAERGSPIADFVLIDCPPSLGILSMNALCAAREVLLPIQTHFFALQGVAGILECLRAVRRLNRELELSLVLPAMVDRRTTLAREVMDEIRTYFGDRVARTMVGMNVKLAEAPSHGKTIFEYAPGCPGAADYEALAAEILGEEPAAPPSASEESDELDDSGPTSTDPASVPDEGIEVYAADSTHELARPPEAPLEEGLDPDLDAGIPSTTAPLGFGEDSDPSLPASGNSEAQRSA